jgi:serine/threonine protein phosphatase 1
MGRLIAISDIHGCCLTFQQLLQNIDFSVEDRLVLCGDYIDRGPRSKQVLDLILHYIEKGYAITCLKGNHEVMFLEAYSDSSFAPRFMNAGGDLTLASFGVATIEEIPKRYIDFFKHLKNYHLEDDCLFVHAGLNFNIENPLEDTEAMFWTRGMVVDPKKVDFKTVIYGHTPISVIEIENMITERSTAYMVDIDNGCVFTKEGMNNLLAYFPLENNFVVQKNIDYL